MKILSITAQKPNSTGSGVYLTELVRNWHAQGHTQAIVAGVYPEDVLDYPEGVRIYPVHYGTEALPYPILGMSDEMPYESTRYRDLDDTMLDQFGRAFHTVIREAVEALQPDLIVCHHLYLLTAMVREWFPQAKIVGISHGSDLRQLTKTPLMREYIRTQISRLDRIVSLQEAQKGEILRIFQCDPEKLRVIGAGYNHTVFRPDPEAPKPSCKHLVYAGKITEKKGVFSLLRALEYLPYKPEKLKVSLAGGTGHPEEFSQIEALARKSRYPVDFLGVLPQKELAKVFQTGDVFVLPSFFEGLPLVTIESMACGCKVVCSDLPGLSQWFDTHVPGHEMEFVPLPDRKNADEPDSTQLPAFERRLAQSIQKKLDQTHPEHPHLESVSWSGISKRILPEE